MVAAQGFGRLGTFNDTILLSVLGHPLGTSMHYETRAGTTDVADTSFLRAPHMLSISYLKTYRFRSFKPHQRVGRCVSSYFVKRFCIKTAGKIFNRSISVLKRF